MATITLTVTYIGLDEAGNYRYNFAVDVNWEGDTPHNWINLYASLEGGDWGFLFMLNVGTGQTGSAVQEFTIGSHITGQSVAFYAGVPGVIASNQVTIIVGAEEPPPNGEPPVAPPLEIDLPVIVTAGLGVADAFLVAAYLLKHFKVID